MCGEEKAVARCQTPGLVAPRQRVDLMGTSLA
jgi:hypothetical protein